MPKIIENIRERLLEEAKKQVMENGYANMTIRSVAKECGVGVGTVYNYFSSKDMLVAGFMLSDWQQSLEEIYEYCSIEASMQQVLGHMHRILQAFIAKYITLFQDKSAGISFTSAFPERHKQLRGQIAAPLLPLCRELMQKSASQCSQPEDKDLTNAESTVVSPEFLSEFLAENLLNLTMEGRTETEIVSILTRFL